MDKHTDPFEKFREKKEREKLEKKGKKEKEPGSKTEKLEGYHISSFFKHRRPKKKKK